LICPKCHTDYRDGVYLCANCHLTLVHREVPGNAPRRTEPAPSPSEMVAIMETVDSYDFLTAADTLREAGVPFTGDERYTGEFLVGERSQAPYVWALMVPVERVEEARGLIYGDRESGPSVPGQLLPNPASRKYTLKEKLIILAALLLLLACGIAILLRNG